MAKKALINTTEPRGKDNSGYRVLEVVEVGNEFETHPTLQWKDCPDTIEMDKYWYNPSTSVYKKLPHAVDQSTAGELAVDAEGNPTEAYDWDWDNEAWTKVQVL